MTKKAVIISGGGSLGAYGGGTLARINKKYDLAIGISTGALMSPLTVLGDWDMLKYAYTTINQQNIFDSYWYKPSPFKADGRIKVLPVLISLILGDKTIGTSNNLRKTIKFFFTEENYNKILSGNKNVIVASQNLAEEPSKLHYFNLKYDTYEDFCLSQDTEILTKRGFLNSKELNDDDEIVSWKNNQMLYEKPERIIRKEYSGKMLHFEGESFECLVTPEHKMGYYKSNGKIINGKKTANWLWEEKTADKLLPIGKTSIKSNYKFPVSGHIKNEEYNIKDDEIRLLGWLITEGWVGKNKKFPNTYRYGLGQSPIIYPNKVKEIDEILNNLKIDFNVNIRKKDGFKTYQIKIKSRDYVDILINNDLRRIPRKYLSGFSERQLNILLKTLMDGDGNWKSMSFSSNHIDLIEDVQELCHKIGRVAKIGKNGKKNYVLYIMQKDIDRHVRKIEEINYDGKIWCVTVPSGFITIKYNNKISVVGNCDWMWCSANVPLFTTLVKKNWKDESGNFHVGLWCDGGISELIALDQVIGKQVREVDVIIHRCKPQSKFEGKKILNLVDTATATINAMRYDIELEHFKNKVNELTQQGIKVNVWWLPKKLTNNSLIFNKSQMKQWWEEGYSTAFDDNRMEVFEPNKKTIT